MSIWSKLFKKKKAPVVQSSCTLFGHIWQDMPWFFHSTYYISDRRSEIYLKEIYICRVCHETKEVTLGEYITCNCSKRQHREKLSSLVEQFDNYIEPEAVIQDMIYDMKLVDREKLKYWEQLHEPEKGDNNGQSNLPAVREK